jgi:transposase
VVGGLADLQLLGHLGDLTALGQQPVGLPELADDLPGRVAASLQQSPPALVGGQDSHTRWTNPRGQATVIAGRLLGRTGRASRFPTAAHFASSTGAAPIEVASGERIRHRLSRAGDRQLNHALHIIALVQGGTPGCAGDHYVRRRLAEGKTRREAMRCLKRRIADHLWRVMLSDEQARNHHQPQAA